MARLTISFNFLALGLKSLLIPWWQTGQRGGFTRSTYKTSTNTAWRVNISIPANYYFVKRISVISVHSKTKLTWTVGQKQCQRAVWTLVITEAVGRCTFSFQAHWNRQTCCVVVTNGYGKCNCLKNFNLFVKTCHNMCMYNIMVSLTKMNLHGKYWHNWCNILV